MHRFGSALAAVAAGLVGSATPTRADFVACVVPAGVVGNQTDGAGRSSGVDFDVLGSGVRVTQHGAFGSGEDGLIAPVAVGVYNRATQQLVASATFAAGVGTGAGVLVGGSRFVDVAPVTLAAGFRGSVVAFGYGDGVTAEADGNTFGAPAGTACSRG